MKQYINATRLVTKIKMLRSGKANKGFIVVEGITDYRLYGKFVFQNVCEMIVADSKSNVIQCIQACNEQKIRGIIGIADADFWRLEQQYLKVENLFLTDFHDVECMMINSPAYENVLAEYANRNKYLRFEEQKRHSLKQVILENAAKVGYLRWYSLKYNLGLRFSNIDFNRFVSAEDLEVDLIKLIDYVLVHSKKQHLLKVNTIVKELKGIMKNQHNLWDVCCGHDMMELLTIGFINIFGDYNAKSLFPGNLEGSFRLAYEYNYFSRTELYNNLNEWEKLNSSYSIFDNKSIRAII